ncbi:alpha/beta hydrolase [Hoeflea sp. TYP-13]|uniref:alpha/beta hydrolase n=1 Tax=Hoeflea sp. TYP-13 TaxID=3230023 RepID=UPI0034C6AB9A
MLILSGCGSRGEFAFSDANPLEAKQHTILVATSRKQEDGPYTYGRGRANETQFMRFDVSVPGSHKTGQIEWPKDRLNPDKHFYVAKAEKFGTPSDFYRAVAHNNVTPSGSSEITIFVHGYNTNLAEGVYRVAQMTHDFEGPGTQILFSWPSAAQAAGYVYDRDSAVHARDRLQSLLEDLAQKSNKKILLIGHSMGSYLVTETLRQMSLQKKTAALNKLNGVVLMSPDIDVEVFRSQAKAIKPFPEPFVLFVARQDRALRLSAFITRTQQRLGSIEYLDGLDDIDVTVIDVTDLADGQGLNHSVAATSPAAISVLRGLSGPEELARIRSGHRPETWLGALDITGNAVRVELRRDPP